MVEPGQDLLKHNGVHIHFPAGAVSKEGPSAGVTIAVALISLFTGLPVDTSMAFTGEITLQGIVLPVKIFKTEFNLDVKFVLECNFLFLCFCLIGWWTSRENISCSASRSNKNCFAKKIN